MSSADDRPPEGPQTDSLQQSFERQGLSDFYSTIISKFQALLQESHGISPSKSQVLDDLLLNIRLWGERVGISTSSLELFENNHREEAGAVRMHLENVFSSLEELRACILGGGIEKTDSEEKSVAALKLAVEELLDLSDSVQTLVNLDAGRGPLVRVRQALSNRDKSQGKRPTIPVSFRYSQNSESVPLTVENQPPSSTVVQERHVQKAVDDNSYCELCGYRPRGDPKWFKGSMAKHKNLQHSTDPPRTYLQYGGDSQAKIASLQYIATNVPERAETPPKPSFNLPFCRDPDFVEVNPLLEQVSQACSEPGSRVALIGLGGVGKSQIAIEHAYRVNKTFSKENKDIWVFWVNATTQEHVEEDLRVIANTAKIPGRNQSGVDIFQLIYHWLQNDRNGRWLMILDNANDDLLSYGEYLPRSSNGSMLITTRDKNLALRLTGNHRNVIKVRPMNPAHALELLLKKSKSYSEMQAATKLVEALEYVPLAIGQSAAFIEKAPRYSITRYLREFQKSEQTKFDLLIEDAGDPRRDKTASNSVVITWQISLDHIRSKRPSATELLSLMSFFNRQGIPESLVRPLSQVQNLETKAHQDESVDSSHNSDDGFQKDITILSDYCLVNMNERDKTFEMNGLVQLSTRMWLKAHGENERFMALFITRMTQALVEGADSNGEILLPHAEKAVEYDLDSMESQKKLALLLYHSSWYALEQGSYDTAETMARKSHDIRQTILGAEHLDTLNSMNNLALTWHHQGQWRATILLLTQVMEARTRLLGEEHPETLTSMDNLASTYLHHQQWEKAKPLLVQVMETKKTVLGAEHFETLASMDNLALMYQSQELWEEAELLMMQIIETRKKTLGVEYPETLASMSNLALIYQNQGQWKEAERIGVQVMEKASKVLGAKHPETLTSMSNLALTYQNQGRMNEAEWLEVQVMEIRWTTLGAEHPETLGSMYNVAWIWRSQGRIAEAIQLMEGCTGGYIRVLGLDHEDTMESLSALTSWRAQSSGPEGGSLTNC